MSDEERMKEYYDRWKEESAERRFAYNHPIEEADEFKTTYLPAVFWYGDYECSAQKLNPFDHTKIISVKVLGFTKSEAEFKAAREWFDFHIRLFRENRDASS